jgi:hypothetical protein
MSSLEEHLIVRIHPEVSHLWAVADGDGLFRSDGVARLLASRGAELLIYEDPMAFRLRYEQEVRPRMESADPGCYVIVIDPGNEGLRSLPADIYGASQHIEVALADLFPALPRKVLSELEPGVLSELWRKRDQFPAGAQGDKETADLILRIAYKIEPSFINSLQDFVQQLVSLHFAGIQLPNELVLRLAQVAAPATGHLPDVHELIRSHGAFWALMQQEWKNWICPSAVGKVQLQTREVIDFDNPKLRVWMDNLFLEGVLRPVDNAGGRLPSSWCSVGVVKKDSESRLVEFAAIRKRLLEAMPGAESAYGEWLTFAQRYSAYVASLFSADQQKEEIESFWSELWQPVDERFMAFVENRLESLANLPPTRPVLINHIPRFLARRVAAGSKVALLVLDGLSIAQWCLIREQLVRVISDLRVNEETCFSLTPSLTNVARQALYSGELPVFFEASIERTDLDAKRWKNFWDSASNKPVRSQHLSLEGNDGDAEALKDSLQGGASALGVTVRMPDEIVHGATMGWRGVCDQVRLWAKQAFLSDSVRAVLSAGYELYLTADHGNIEAIGEGSVPQGVLVERSGQRVRIYRDETIFAHSSAQLASRARNAASKLLPPSYLPLVHSGRGAYVQTGQIIVTHGGNSLDEMIVPFAQLSLAKQP